MSKFPLQSVLEHRQRLEEQRQMRLALAELHLSQAEASVRLAQSRLATLTGQMNALKTAASVDGHAIVAVEIARVRAHVAVERASAEAAVAAVAVAEARAATVSAGQDRLAVERLRDTFNLAARTVADHAEQERLGELSLNRWRALVAQSDQKGGS